GREAECCHGRRLPRHGAAHLASREPERFQDGEVATTVVHTRHEEVANSDRADQREKDAQDERDPIDWPEPHDLETTRTARVVVYAEASNPREPADPSNGGVLVDAGAELHQDRELTVRVVRIEPIEPATGEDGAVGDSLRIREHRDGDGADD